jgi:predicted dehydrogenase
MPPRASRRRFLASAATSTAAFTILSSGSARTYAANEKLNIAAIGAGGRAASVLRGVDSENIVALCDVDEQRAAESFATYSRAKRYKDYRVMLDELHGSIDAVIVATPDHHHFHASMAALRLGKHVYCEKPLTHSVWEARQLTAAAQEAGVATQMGNQAQASKDTRRVQEFILDNAIGPVREVHIWTDRPGRGLDGEFWPQGLARPSETPEVPATLDWDLWLGPAPERPYNPAYVPFTWRGWWDFGTGALGDMGCHYFDPVVRALKLGPPSSVEATSTRVNEETYPQGSMVTYRFPARESMPAVTLTWYDGGLRPSRPTAFVKGDLVGANGLMLVGDDGLLMSDWDDWWLLPDELAKAYGDPPKVLPRSPGHYEEWLLACRGGEPAGACFDFAGPLTETVLLGNIALRGQLREGLTQKRLMWDAEGMTFPGSPEAEQFLRREYRTGWQDV